MLKKMFLGLVSLSLALPSFASVQVGTIKSITVRDSDGLIYFTLNAARTGAPSCAGNAYWMIKDEKSVSGKQLYALILAAQLSGKTVTVEGMHVCTRWGDGEDVRSITIND